MKRPYGSRSDLVCAAALRIGVMKRDGTTWKFKRRRYSNETGDRAVVHGIAVKHGNELRAAAPPQYSSAPQPSLTRAGGLA